MMGEYPERPQYFATHFTRLLFETSAPSEIGIEAVALLILIVHGEDSLRYRRPVRYWNQHLENRLSVSLGRLNRARKRAIDAGWLAYNPGRRGTMGTYWVEIPDRFRDELPFQNGSASGGQAAGNTRNTEFPFQNESANGGQTAGKRRANARLSFPLPKDLNPKKNKGGLLKEDLEVANWIWERIRAMQPERREPDLSKWADTVRLMREREHRTHAEIKDLFELVQRSEFWRVNILSPAKLRDKWDDLMLKLKPVSTKSTDAWESLPREDES